MKAEIVDNTLKLEIPLETTPRPSKSGKTKIVASTGGFVELPVEHLGKPVSLSLNAVIR